MKPTTLIDNQGIAIQALGLGDSQLVDGSGASAQSTVLDEDDRTLVRLAAIGDIWVTVGENPTAATNQGAYFADGTVEYLVIPLNNKIACVGGKANITIAQ